MTRKLQSKPPGALSQETTVPPLDMQSSSVESPSTSVTLGITPKAKSPNGSQLISKSPPVKQIPPNVFFANAVVIFANKLVNLELAEWRTLSLADGRNGYALFLPVSKWMQDPISKEITPL